MKYASSILVLSSITTAVVADGTHSHAIRKGITALSSPINVTVDCSDPNAPEWCKDLYKAACEIKKTSDKKGQLSQVIEQRTYDKLPKSPMKQQVNDAAEAAIKLADDIVYKQGKVVRKDVIDTFMDTKTTLYQVITSNNFLSPSKKKELTGIIEKVKLRTGFEYVDELVKWGMKQDPSKPLEDARREAMEAYMSSCGHTGLDVNAFYHSGNIILCPGLVFSLEDYNSKGKQDILNALSFTIGHEIGHAFDYTDQPGMYGKLRSCYETITQNKELFRTEIGNEIVGDYWGTLVLAQRLKNQKVNGADTVRTVGMAIDGFCAPPENPDRPRPPAHPESNFRVNMTIARAPMMRESLGCDAPSPENPTCWLDGILNKNVR